MNDGKDRLHYRLSFDKYQRVRNLINEPWDYKQSDLQLPLVARLN